MTDPINYSAMLTQPDFNPLMQGMQIGIQRDQQRAQQRSLEAEAALHQQKYSAEQAENAGYQDSVAGVVANPTFENFAAHTLRYPKQIEASKAAWEAYNPAIQTRNMNFMMSVHGLISSGNIPAALKLAEQRRAALLDTTDGSKPEDTQQTDALIGLLKSGDPKQIAAAKGMAFLGIGIAAGADKFANIVNAIGGDASYTLAPGNKRFDRDNNLLADAPFAPDRFTLGPGETRFEGSSGGGGTASGYATPGYGAGSRSDGGDVSRLINTDAGGGYVPGSVKTLGQFVGFGRSLNKQGVKSSSAGTYQINGTTMAEFAPKALGDGWRSQPFNAESQERVGEAIFNWAKSQSNPAAALRGRWVSLSPQDAAQAVQGTWQQARGVIAQGETGGGAGASAGASPAGGARATATGGPRPASDQARRMTPAEVQAEGLDAATVYYRNKDGIPTPVGGQAKPKAGAGGDQAYSQSAMDSFDRAIGSAKQLLAHKGLSAAVGSGFDPSSWGSFNPINGETLAGTNAADFMARLGTLKAQVFLPMVQSMKGMGALSNAEGEKLTAAIGALDTKQSEGEFKSSLNQIVADLNTYKKRAAGKGGGNASPPAQGRQLSVAEAAKLPPGTRFIGTDGKARVRQ